MKQYKVTVTGEPTDYEDARSNPNGIYTVNAKSYEDALDEFHATVPIACLEDFDIDVFETH